MERKNEKISKKVPFDMFREKLADYVIKTLTHPDDVVKIIKKMKDPEAEFEKEHMPTDLTAEEAKSMAKKSIFEQKCKLYVAREQTMKSNKSKIYSLIWGQCSPGLRAVVQGDKDFETKEEKRDVLWVLEQVKLATAGIDVRANQYENMRQVLLTFLNMRQGETESNDDYLERFKSNAETVKLTGGKSYFGSGTLMNTLTPTDDELAESDEKFRAMCLVQRADDNRFGSLIKRLKASMDVGRNEYPTTVADAYDLLVRTANDVASRNNNNGRNNRQNNTRVMFAQQRTSNDTTLVPGTDGRVIPQVDCWNCLQPGHTMHNCPEPVNAENRRRHGISAFMVGHLFSQNSGNMISDSWILIDTGSTVDVSNNPAHVTNIRPCRVDEKLKILTNGGSLNYDKMATLKLLPMEVHYNASSMATILSLASVDALDGVYITMDTREQKAIMVHVDGSILVFKMCFDGLFYFDTANPLAHTINDDKEAVIPYNFLQTVGGNKSFFTKREIKGANQA